jgi:hypothetical protein
MAVNFDRTKATDYFAISDAAELTFQDGDWCVGIWSKIHDDSGSEYRYLVSNKEFNTNSSFNLYFSDSSNRWTIAMFDDDGDYFQFFASATPADSLWRLLIIQRRVTDSELQMWFCEEGETATKEASSSDAGFDASNGNDWNVGRRVDAVAGKYFEGDACEFFKGDFSLTQSEIEALADGHSILSLGKSPDVYLPMWSAEAQIDFSGNGNSGTKNGTPTIADHASVMTPVKRGRM